MKRYVLFVLLSLILIFQTYAGSPRYSDDFYIQNSTSKIVHVQYTAGERVEPAIIGSFLDMETYLISLSYISCITENVFLLSPGGEFFLWYNSYMRDEYSKIAPWEKFKLIVATLTVTDEEGNVLLTFDDITEEDFEIHREGGITTATLIIRERYAL